MCERANADRPAKRWLIIRNPLEPVAIATEANSAALLAKVTALRSRTHGVLHSAASLVDVRVSQSTTGACDDCVDSDHAGVRGVLPHPLQWSPARCVSACQSRRGTESEEHTSKRQPPD